MTDGAPDPAHTTSRPTAKLHRCHLAAAYRLAGTMTVMTNAIETMYAGCRFRSRLEARWAVFFDAIKVAWEYEPQGFEIRLTEDEVRWRWLPDFHLPELHVWVEVKGSDDQVTDDYRLMLAHACDWGQGPADIESSYFNGGGLLLLGSIPHPDKAWGHTLIQHHKGIVDRIAIFTMGGLSQDDHSGAAIGEWSDAFADGLPADATFAARPVPFIAGPKDTNAKPVRDAYIAARSARFEHGDRWR